MFLVKQLTFNGCFGLFDASGQLEAVQRRSLSVRKRIENRIRGRRAATTFGFALLLASVLVRFDLIWLFFCGWNYLHTTIKEKIIAILQYQEHGVAARLDEVKEHVDLAARVLIEAGARAARLEPRGHALVVGRDRVCHSNWTPTTTKAV